MQPKLESSSTTVTGANKYAHKYTYESIFDLGGFILSKKVKIFVPYLVHTPPPLPPADEYTL